MAGLAVVGLHSGHVQTARVIDRTADIGDSYDLGARGVQQLGCIRAHVAETLDRDGAVGQVAADSAQRLASDEQQATTSRFQSTARATQRDRFAGYHAGLDVALLHRERVHHPGHDPRAGAHVWGRDVDGRSDQVENLGDVAPRQALQLTHGQLGRIASNAAFRAAKRNVDNGALPGHPGRERLAVVQIDIGVIANAAFAWATRVVVDDPIALEHPQMPVVHHDRHRYHHLSARVPQRLERVTVRLQDVGGPIELLQNVVERVVMYARGRA